VTEHRGVLGEGTPLVAQLDGAVDTAHAKVGERFTARLATPVDGLPHDARVIAEVTASKRGAGDEDPVLRVRVIGIRAGGCRLPVDARLTAADLQYSEPPPNQKYRGGAIAGGVMGGIMMWWPGMIAGATLGLAGGMVAEAKSQHRDATLPAGSFLTFRLERPLEVRACQRVSRVTPSARPM
jgi:hypothetical protein